MTKSLDSLQLGSPAISLMCWASCCNKLIFLHHLSLPLRNGSFVFWPLLHVTVGASLDNWTPLISVMRSSGLLGGSSGAGLLVMEGGRWQWVLWGDWGSQGWKEEPRIDVTYYHSLLTLGSIEGLRGDGSWCFRDCSLNSSKSIIVGWHCLCRFQGGSRWIRNWMLIKDIPDCNLNSSKSIIVGQPRPWALVSNPMLFLSNK